MSYRRSRPLLGVDRPEAVGPALRDLRKSQDVSIYDVAEAMPTGHGTTVTSWETSRVIPNTRKLLEVLTVYDYVLAFVHKDELAKIIAERSRSRKDPWDE